MSLPESLLLTPKIVHCLLMFFSIALTWPAFGTQVTTKASSSSMELLPCGHIRFIVDPVSTLVNDLIGVWSGKLWLLTLAAPGIELHVGYSPRSRELWMFSSSLHEFGRPLTTLGFQYRDWFLSLLSILSHPQSPHKPRSLLIPPQSQFGDFYLCPVY